MLKVVTIQFYKKLDNLHLNLCNSGTRVVGVTNHLPNRFEA